MWISGSSTRNYVLGNTLRDFLDKTRGTTKFSKYENWAMQQGNTFEQKVFEYLDKKYNVVKIVSERDTQPIEENIQKTLKAIKDGEIIIFQAPVVCKQKEYFGTVDFLIRSDYFNFIFNKKILSQEEIHPDGREFVYYCIDVKYKTLEVKNKNGNLTNTVNNNIFRTQLLIYNYCIQEMTGFFPSKSFILGRAMKIKQKISHNCFSSLGIIDWDKEYVMTDKLLENCKEWKNNLNQNWKNWSIFPLPSVKELYPNVLSTHCSEEETTIAHQLFDSRIIHGVNIKDYKNWKTCEIDDLYTKNSDTNNIIKTFVEVNRSNKSNIYELSDSIKKEICPTTNIFVDYETVSNVFDDFSKFPLIENRTYIFLIGASYKTDETSKKQYKFWVMKELSDKEQIRIMTEFIEWTRRFPKSNLIHWAPAEPSMTKKVIEQHPELQQKYSNLILPWYDLMKFFKDNAIIFSGMFNFKLKSVARSMKNLGYLKEETCYLNYEEEDGLSYMMNAIDLYSKDDLAHSFIGMNNIVKYNKADCEIMSEISSFLIEYIESTKKRKFSLSEINQSEKRVKKIY